MNIHRHIDRVTCGRPEGRRRPRHLALASFALGVAALTAASACGPEDEPFRGPSTTTTATLDAGCDGCDASTDVQQPDPCEGATEPTTGCACEAAGERLFCGQAYAKIGDQVVCGPGFMTCEADLRWGECILNNAAEPPPS